MKAAFSHPEGCFFVVDFSDFCFILLFEDALSVSLLLVEWRRGRKGKEEAHSGGEAVGFCLRGGLVGTWLCHDMYGRFFRDIGCARRLSNSFAQPIWIPTFLFL